MSERWTSPELEYLRQHAPSTPATVLALRAELSGRSEEAIRCACIRHSIELKKELNIVNRHRWSDTDQRFLQENAAKLTLPEIAAALKVTEPQAYQYMERHDFEYRHARRVWTKAEEFRLMGLIERHNADEAAKILKRPRASVVQKMKQLNLHAYSGMYTLASLAEETGYHYTQLLQARDALEQKWRRDGHRYIISPTQVKNLMEYFRNPAQQEEVA